MTNSRMAGVFFMIIGVLFIADAALSPPIHWLRVGAGVAFVVAGLIGLARARSHPILPTSK